MHLRGLFGAPWCSYLCLGTAPLLHRFSKSWHHVSISVKSYFEIVCSCDGVGSAQSWPGLNNCLIPAECFLRKHSREQPTLAGMLVSVVLLLVKYLGFLRLKNCNCVCILYMHSYTCLAFGWVCVAGVCEVCGMRLPSPTLNVDATVAQWEALASH